MKGLLWTGNSPTRRRAGKPPGAEPLQRWEAIAVDAVGNVIEFWGFKRNQGRVWALLYLRDTPLTAQELERTLSLSKGGVSMLLRDLESWGVIQRVREPGSSAWRYRAETELLQMVRKVIESREGEFIARIRADLTESLRLAQQPGAKISRDRMERLRRMNQLADQTERALRLFVKTARLDVGGMFGVFRQR